MNNVFKNIVVFAIGAAVGSIATWKLLKTTYEQITREEIASVKEAFSKREKDLNDQIDEAHEIMKDNDEKEEEVVTGIHNHMKDHEYVDYSSMFKGNKKEIDDRPYVISPDEFGESDYIQVNLTYYADGVLVDEDDELVEDVEGTVGFESLNHFGEYEDDAVHVKNDRLAAEYEILLDQRKYSDVIKQRHK